MRTRFHFPNYLLLVVLLCITSFPTAAGGAIADRQPVSAQVAVLPSAAADTATLVLHEVMPKAAGGAPEWIELRNTAPFIADTYLPIINKNTSTTSAATASTDGIVANALVEGASVTIAGWQLTDKDGLLYTIPAGLPPVPAGGYVLIYLDGQGPAADQLQFVRGVAILHTPAGVVGRLDDAADQVALYRGNTHSPVTLQDFVAWGAAPGKADDAIAAGLWAMGAYLDFAPSAGYVAAGAALGLQPNESAGRFPGYIDVWSIYRRDQLSPGAPNPVPNPAFRRPADGDIVDAANVVLGWSVLPNAAQYTIQIATDVAFSNLVVDTVTPYADYHHNGLLGPGTFYWRVRSEMQSGNRGPWSAPLSLQTIDFGVTAASLSAEKTLGITWQVQHKDTPLLDLSQYNNFSGDGAWDKPHPADHRVTEHDNHYCQVAGMSMIASYYGGDISQERLSYYAIREWPDSKRGLDPDRTCLYPECMPDLKDDFWAGRNKGLEALAWSLGYAWNDFSQIDRYAYDPPTTTIPFGNIRSWIDANRPLLVAIPGHIMVVDGYRTGPPQQIHLLDPWTSAQWVAYTSNSIQRINWIAVYKAPGTAGAPPAARSDEPSIWTDSDGDGVQDYDEVKRFHTNPFAVDSDDDWVRDKQDILETVYKLDGTYVYTPTRADFDSDTLRKELDWDNDADNAPDGCEDVNVNGGYEPALGESNNFDSASHNACVPQFNILWPRKTSQANAGDPTAPEKILVQVSTAVPTNWPQSYTSGDFTVAIGGQNSPVLTVYPSGDTYFLVVSPHTQSSGGPFDLTVQLASQSDTETQAVYYLPKNPQDEVVVMDRSGSMAYDGKIDAAKNAGNAFVDMLNDNDWVGVASFATTASTDYTLHEITGQPIRNAANAAINALVADGTTALGQGVQQGYGLLTAAAHTDHDWTMVLLSDGMENEPPYWADVAPGITDVVMHTVALGEDANRTLLQSIAGAKDGNFFYVDIDPPIPPPLDAAALSAPLAVPFLDETLANRLADTYVAIGELSQGWQRLFEAHGQARDGKIFDQTVPVEKGLAGIIFTLNWDDPAGDLTLRLRDPKGNPVTPTMELRAATHHQLRVRDPVAGNWTALIQIEKPTAEYHLMVSAKTPTTLIAAVGGDPTQRGVGQPVPLYGILTDQHAILGAKVVAYVVKPDGSSTLQQLYDDGNHGDGKGDDGLYAADFTATTVAGGYVVKLAAEGVNNQGEPFIRYAQTAFNVRHRALYLWESDQETALDVARLLEAHDWLVDRVHLRAVPTIDLRNYALLIIGPETGERGDFHAPDVAGLLLQYPLPVLGMGEGGAAFFELADLRIGWSNTWYSTNNEIFAVAPSSRYWQLPYAIDLGATAPLVKLYPGPLTELGVYVPEPGGSLELIAREVKDQHHYPVIRENRRERSFLLWGYNAGPSAMTKSGQALFVNVAQSLR
ncbi:MAG TPA: VWA domain-containing protein [Caldilineaceae bacterium]|nr:VWA domain-containing protein [Caldilineaceae bacterium]